MTDYSKGPNIHFYCDCLGVCKIFESILKIYDMIQSTQCRVAINRFLSTLRCIEVGEVVDR